MKRCSKCGKIKHLIEFSKGGRHEGDVRSRCKNCIKEDSREYYLKNRKTVKDKSIKYYQEHVDRVRKRIGVWKQRNPEKVREQERTRRARKEGCMGEITAQEWVDLKKFYEFTCLRCERKEPEIKLTLDHVIPVKLGGANTIENAQPLCRPCNSSKGVSCTDYRIQKPTFRPV